MKCPKCVASDQTSKVYDRGSVRHLLGWSPYYDEDGEYHAHDPNAINASYSCSNGHSFNHVYKRPCPSKSCSYGKEESA